MERKGTWSPMTIGALGMENETIEGRIDEGVV
jgi:hypothetical protein